MHHPFACRRRLPRLSFSDIGPQKFWERFFRAVFSRLVFSFRRHVETGTPMEEHKSSWRSLPTGLSDAASADRGHGHFGIGAEAANCAPPSPAEMRSDRSRGYAAGWLRRYAAGLAMPRCWRSCNADPRCKPAMLQSPHSKHGPLSRTSCRGAEARG
jgi:hypothetical protein